MNSAAAEPPFPGHYLGTVIDGKWWKRYRRGGFFARGNGEYWLTDDGFCFLRYLTRTPLVIPFARVVGVEIGKSHAGRWIPGPGGILRLCWEKEGQKLSSGFIVSRRREETEALAALVRESLAGVRKA